MASENVIALAERIRREFGLIVDPENYVTTHAGRHLLAGGAYTWYFFGKNGIGTVSGFRPMKDYLVKRNHLVMTKHEHWNDYEIDAIKPGEPGYDSAEFEKVIE